MSNNQSIENYDELPDDYTSWINENSPKESSNGFMIYSGPIPVNEIIDSYELENNILIVADDMAGYMIGYRRYNDNWEFIGIDSCEMEIETISEKFRDYIDI